MGIRHIPSIYLGKQGVKIDNSGTLGFPIFYWHFNTISYPLESRSHKFSNESLYAKLSRFHIF